jgi:hypothetical protein
MRAYSDYGILVKLFPDLVKYQYDPRSLDPELDWKELLVKPKRRNLIKRLFYGPEVVKWDYERLSQSPNIDLSVVKQLMNQPWRWRWISANPGITWDDIKSNPELPWVWYYVSTNPNITWDIIEANPDIPWSWPCVLLNPDLTWGRIKSSIWTQRPPWTYGYHQDDDRLITVLRSICDSQDWITISSHPSITWDYIVNNPELPWAWEGISMNPNITWAIIEAHPEKPWCWNYISYNPNITWSIIEAHPELPWHLENMILNPNLTWLDIKNKPLLMKLLECEARNTFNNRIYYDIDGSYVEKTKYKKTVGCILERFVPAEITENIMSFI